MAIVDPRDIPGLVAWYSAEAETGYADNTLVTGWTDRSGVGNHAVRDAVRANGTRWRAAGGATAGPRYSFLGNAWLVLPNVMVGATAGTIVASIKSGGGINEGGHWNFDSGNFFGYYPYSDGTVYENFGYVGDRHGFASSGYPASITGWHRYAVKVASASSRTYLVNNTSVSTSTGGTAGFRTDPRIGEGQYPFIGDMGAVIIYNRALTTAELADLDAWLAANPSGGTPASPPPPPVVIPLAAFSGEGTLEVSITLVVEPELTLQILDPVIQQTPTPITVVLVEGVPETDVVFTIDSIVVGTVPTDSDGYLAPTSINIPETFGAGSYVLTATQPGSKVGTATFTILQDPTSNPIVMGPDAQAVEIPGSVAPDGRRKWVFQDLLPGGLGSWIMPTSPTEMSSPYRDRQYVVQTTTAGAHHVSEGARVPVQWSFSGFAPDEEFAEKLLAYGDLNRRFYVIDHRGRAFKVVFTDVDLRPRLKRIYNEEYVDGHDYTISALVIDQNWVTPA